MPEWISFTVPGSVTHLSVFETTVVEPGDDDLLVRNTIVYGSFGNVASITSSDAAGEMRTTGFTYDALDMYPATTTNALGHTSSVTVHPGLGVVLEPLSRRVRSRDDEGRLVGGRP